jgi:NAD(P)-dependent dehydrogenase (short-subunit alcohol dehydrogenase family)
MTDDSTTPVPAARALAGRVAVVAGATRGAGRGIARALGEAGAVVYCTGRSVRGAPSPYGRSETVEETAALVDAAGGTGIAARVDHADEAQVAALFGRVAGERGRLDVLVTCVAGEDPRLGGHGPFWDADLASAAAVLRDALLSHLVTAKHAAPLMTAAGRGVLVAVSEGDLLLGGSGGVLHDLVKSGVKALAVRLAEELRPRGVAALAVTPGFLRSETMLEHFGVAESGWRDGVRRDPHFAASESPLFVGRCVAALAADPDVMAQSGLVTSSWELAARYGVVDHDGRRPDWGAHWRDVVLPDPAFAVVRAAQARQVALLARLAARGRRYLGDAAS